ncbi:enoyl-ACP reductase FabI [Halocola ammonii]
MNKNKNTAIILGASSGMGFASAKKLASEGFDLVLVYRSRKSDARKVEEAFEDWRRGGIEIRSFNADALKEENINSILDELSEAGVKVDLMLHSLAKGNLKPMAPKSQGESVENTLSEDDFSITINAMAVSYYSWAKAILSRSLFSEDASLLALTSEGARKAWRNYGAVAAAKSALESINRNLALELAPLGLRANVLQPGITDTPALRMIPGSDKLIEGSLKRNPYHRLTTPEDVANAVYLFSKPESKWINGAVIPVDGGENIA